MANNQINHNNLLELDEDYEIESADMEAYIDIDDLFNEIYQEQIRFRDIEFVELSFLQLDYHESELELARLKTEVLDFASAVLTPRQLLAIYIFSNYDAIIAKHANKRKQLILKEMELSQSLQDYQITDFNEFCRRIMQFDSSVFLLLTNILYRSQITQILKNQFWHNLTEHEKNMNYKNNFI